MNRTSVIFISIYLLYFVINEKVSADTKLSYGIDLACSDFQDLA